MRTLLRTAMGQLFGRRGQRRVAGWRLLYRLRVQVLLRSRGAIAELTHPQRVRVWVDYEESFRRIRRLLSRARHTVVIQMFIWKDDEVGRGMADLLLRIADRGVQIHIAKEAVGDVFELHRDFLATRDGDDPMWKRFWTHPHIRISYAHHNDHAKVYLIDDRILLLTGMNIADEYRHWHDYLVELRGSGFAAQYLTQGEISHATASARLIMNTERAKAIRPALMTLLRSARKAIVVEHSYLSDPQAIALLARRSREGIRVTVILPSRPDVHHHSNMLAVAELLREGDPRRLRVFLFPGMCHGKIILVDRETAFVGSANLMSSSLDEMGEVNVLLRPSAEGAIRKLRNVLREDILRSKALSGPPHLSWASKWLAWVKL